VIQGGEKVADVGGGVEEQNKIVRDFVVKAVRFRDEVAFRRFDLLNLRMAQPHNLA
jgi:hypothetical protein